MYTRRQIIALLSLSLVVLLFSLLYLRKPEKISARPLNTDEALQVYLETTNSGPFTIIRDKQEQIVIRRSSNPLLFWRKQVHKTETVRYTVIRDNVSTTYRCVFLDVDEQGNVLQSIEEIPEGDVLQ